jgi:hypothetical protein
LLRLHVHDDEVGLHVLSGDEQHAGLLLLLIVPEQPIFDRLTIPLR